MKYIDADKLLAEIERREIILNKYKDSFETAACCKQELEWMKDFISSLQQEQPEVDLEKEIKNEIDEYWYDSDYGAIQRRGGTITMEVSDVKEIARHFAEWGATHLNTRKEE